MKTKILLIGTATVLAIGAICHVSGGDCPLKAMKKFHQKTEIEKPR